MNLDTLKNMAVAGLVNRHIHELQTAGDHAALATFALAFRDELADIIAFDPHAPVPRGKDDPALMGIRMS